MRYLKHVLRTGRPLSRSACFLGVLFCFLSSAQADETRAVIQGVSGVYLRSGPGLSHPPIGVLSENTPLVIEEKEGDWYLVSTVDGQKGYVYQSLVNVIGVEQAATTPKDASVPEPSGEDREVPAQPGPAKSPPAVVKSASAGGTEGTPEDKKAVESTAPSAATQAPAVTDANHTKSVQAKSPPLIHLLEGREADMVLWLAIAVVFFLIGWICGGNYYLRRDRYRRTKLRF